VGRGALAEPRAGGVIFLALSFLEIAMRRPISPLALLLVLALPAPAAAQVSFAHVFGPDGNDFPRSVTETAGIARITVTNISGADLQWTATAVTGSAGLAVVTVASGPALPLTLASGESREVDVAATFGDVSAVLEIVTDQGTFTTDVTGYNPASNGVYEIYLGTHTRRFVGTYTFESGPAHPMAQDPDILASAAGRTDLLFGTRYPATSWDTVRSYSSGKDYVMSEQARDDPGFTGVPLASRQQVTAQNGPSEIGFDETYVISTANESDADDLTITRKLRVRGTTFDDSHIDVTTTVRNDGDADAAIGIRYFWDYQIFNRTSGGFDDGTSFQEFRPDGPTRVAEIEFEAPPFAFYGNADCTGLDGEGNALEPPTVYVFGTVSAPALEPQAPVQPDRLQFVAWPGAQRTSFDYAVEGLDVASATGETDDSAVNYYWGPTTATAIILPPGQSITVSQSIFTAEPDRLPTETIPSPLIDVRPTSLDFGPVLLNHARERTVRASNIGTGTLRITAVEVSGGAAFSSPDALPISVAAGDFVDLTFRFAPASTGAVTATARITSDTSDSRVVEVALSGEGVATGAILAVDDPIDFGAVPVGAALTRANLATNIGDQPLTISGISGTGGGFEAASAFPLVIGAGASGLSIRFAPDHVGPFERSVTIASDGVQGPLTVTLRGTGTAGVFEAGAGGRFVGAASGCAAGGAADGAAALPFAVLALAVAAARRSGRPRKA
jgi:hypothetical protein